MNYLIIGGAGFIGSHLVDFLAEDHEVTVMDNLVSGDRRFVNAKASFVLGDIRNRDDLRRVFARGFDRVINLAAQPYIPECYDHPALFFETNAMGALNVILACEEHNVPLLQYASAEEYGTQSGMISETTPLHPQSTYGVSKVAAEHLCRMRVIEKGVRVIVLRQFNCYGPRETHAYVIPEIISQVDASDVIYLGNVEAERDFLYVEDAVRYAVELLETGKSGEAYNLGAGDTIRIKDLAYRIAEISGKTIEIRVDKNKLRIWDIERLQSDNAKIHGIVDYRAQTSLGEGLHKTIQYYRAHGWIFEQGGVAGAV